MRSLTVAVFLMTTLAASPALAPPTLTLSGSGDTTVTVPLDTSKIRTLSDLWPGS
jgi:hypothetical protein